MYIVDKTVHQSLIDNRFQKREVPYNNSSGDNRKEFLFKEDSIHGLRTDRNILSARKENSRPCFH